MTGMEHTEILESLRWCLAATLHLMLLSIGTTHKQRYFLGILTKLDYLLMLAE